MRRNESFHAAYRKLESRLEALARAEGNVFVPNPEPAGRVQYVLICMEPSLGRWADSRKEAKSKVEAGFRNFLYSIGDFILHYAAQRYLCGPGERYYITDLSKGAMLVDQAHLGRKERYDKWYPLLEQEIALVATPNAEIVTVGRVVSDYLNQKSLSQRSLTHVIHYSSQAGRARSAAIRGHEDQFEAYQGSVSHSDIAEVAETTLRSSGVPLNFRNEALARLQRRELTPSREKLLFSYKLAFERRSG